ncbi:MAG: hypothetical protein KDE27_20005 [Planctomycetes bacterium]|nr:hypothetical protein [Planctomycetota bacterium]
MHPAVILTLVAAATFGLRLLVGTLDAGRIRRWLAARGCRLTASRWAPFAGGPSHIGTARLYRVEFDDPAGNRCRALVRTSRWLGVILSDPMLAPATQPRDASAIVSSSSQRA